MKSKVMALGFVVLPVLLNASQDTLVLVLCSNVASQIHTISPSRSANTKFSHNASHAYHELAAPLLEFYYSVSLHDTASGVD